MNHPRQLLLLLLLPVEFVFSLSTGNSLVGRERTFAPSLAFSIRCHWSSSRTAAAAAPLLLPSVSSSTLFSLLLVCCTSSPRVFSFHLLLGGGDGWSIVFFSVPFSLPPFFYTKEKQPAAACDADTHTHDDIGWKGGLGRSLGRSSWGEREERVQEDFRMFFFSVFFFFPLLLLPLFIRTTTTRARIRWGANPGSSSLFFWPILLVFFFFFVAAQARDDIHQLINARPQPAARTHIARLYVFIYICVCGKRRERKTEGRRRMMAREMGSFFASFLFLLDDVPPLLSRRHLSFWPEKGRKQYEMAVRKRSASLFFVCLSVCVLVPFLLIWSSSAFSFFSFSLPLCTWVGGWVGAARLLLSLATDNPSCSVVDVGNRRSSLRARKRVGTLVVVVVVVCNHATFLSFPFFYTSAFRTSWRRRWGAGCASRMESIHHSQWVV